MVLCAVFLYWRHCNQLSGSFFFRCSWFKGRIAVLKRTASSARKALASALHERKTSANWRSRSNYTIQKPTWFNILPSNRVSLLWYFYNINLILWLVVRLHGSQKFFGCILPPTTVSQKITRCDCDVMIINSLQKLHEKIDGVEGLYALTLIN
jgi:hypothetical protein